LTNGRSLRRARPWSWLQPALAPDRA